MRKMQSGWILALVVATICCFTVTESFAQRGQGGGRPGGGPPGGGFGGFGGFGGGPLELVAREDVQKHLELLPDQVDELTALAESQQASQRERFRDLFGRLREGSEEDRASARERIQGELANAAAETQKKIDAILLPHQSKRLSQLAMQRRLRGGLAGAIGNQELAERIGISADQREELQAKARAAEEEFRERLAQLRKEMQDDLLKTLTPAQQAKWNELLGEPFEFAQEERGPGGFGQGGQGGRGGRGGFQPGGGRGGDGGNGGRGQRPAQ